MQFFYLHPLAFTATHCFVLRCLSGETVKVKNGKFSVGGRKEIFLKKSTHHLQVNKMMLLIL
jgi:hypothetical protein